MLIQVQVKSVRLVSEEVADKVKKNATQTVL